MSIDAMKQAKQVIAMMGAPNPLNFSKEEIIAWQRCNADLDRAIGELEGQEPTAWAVMVDGECWSVRRFEPSTTSSHERAIFVPLYPRLNKTGKD